MTDEQIMQGLKWCYQVEGSCGDCPYRPDDIKKAKCHDRLGNDVIGLIKRQQAKIDKLYQTNFNLIKGIGDLVELTRDEAIKEFEDKLKANLSFGKYITGEQIDNLVKDMAGADNG